MKGFTTVPRKHIETACENYRRAYRKSVWLSFSFKMKMHEEYTGWWIFKKNRWDGFYSHYWHGVSRIIEACPESELYLRGIDKVEHLTCKNLLQAGGDQIHLGEDLAKFVNKWREV